MSLSSKQTVTLTRLIIISVLAVIITLVLVWRAPSTSAGVRSYSYVGDDFPNVWDLKLGRVHKAFEDTVHYAFDTQLGADEKNSSLPSGGGILYLGPDRRPFSISLFHQLRCLDIIGRELDQRDANTGDWQAPTQLSTHCMNYLRQMALCRASTRLQSVQKLEAPHITVPWITHTCNDWSAVYTAAEENYAEYVKSQSS